MSEKTTSVEKYNTKFARLNRRGVGGSCSGQTMVEYVILVSMVSILMLGAMGFFVSGLGSFYLNLVKVVTLPFP